MPTFYQTKRIWKKGTHANNQDVHQAVDAGPLESALAAVLHQLCVLTCAKATQWWEEFSNSQCETRKINVFLFHFFKSPPGCCSHLQTAPVRSTSECSSACSPAAGSSRCPASISDRRTSACPWSDPGGCWGPHSRPRLKGQDGCCFLTNTKGEKFIFSTQPVKMYKNSKSLMFKLKKFSFWIHSDW